MARPLRNNVPGVHHVFARGVDRRRVFRDDRDRLNYLEILGVAAGKMSWRCLSYCLMGNHVHLLVEIPEPNLGRGVQRLHGLYGSTFNQRHVRKGHLFESRYGSKLMVTDAQLWWAIAYIARNPVEAGLCADPADWRWSSHGAVRGGHLPRWLDFDRVLEIVGRAGGDPRRRYAELVGG